MPELNKIKVLFDVLQFMPSGENLPFAAELNRSQVSLKSSTLSPAGSCASSIAGVDAVPATAVNGEEMNFRPAAPGTKVTTHFPRKLAMTSVSAKADLYSLTSSIRPWKEEAGPKKDASLPKQSGSAPVRSPKASSPVFWKIPSTYNFIFPAAISLMPVKRCHCPSFMVPVESTWLLPMPLL